MQQQGAHRLRGNSTSLSTSPSSSSDDTPRLCSRQQTEIPSFEVSMRWDPSHCVELKTTPCTSLYLYSETFFFIIILLLVSIKICSYRNSLIAFAGVSFECCAAC